MKIPRIPKPPLPARIALYILTVGIIVLTVLQLNMEFMPEAAEYALYFVSALALAASVYYLIGDIKYLRNEVVRPTVERNKFTGRLVSDYRFRTLTFSAMSFGASVVFALFNGIIGITNRSTWYGAMSAYYILLCVMRSGAIWYVRSSFLHKDSEPEIDREVSTCRRSGILLIILGLALGVVVALVTRGEGAKSYPGYMIYVIAAYTFWKVIMSAVNMVKSRKTSSPLLITLRNINHADALVSVLSLENAMLAEFGAEDSAEFSALMLTITGIVVCAGVMVIGISMAVRPKR